MLLTWAILFLWALRYGSSVPMTKGESHNQTTGPGPRIYKTQQIQEDGIAVKITTIEGEVQAFYKYYEGTEIKPEDAVSPTLNDGVINTNGTPTLIPMRKCPGLDEFGHVITYDLIHFTLFGVANESRYDWDDYGAGLPSPCSSLTPTTTPITTTADGESGNDMKQPSGIIHFLIWTTLIVGISYH